MKRLKIFATLILLTINGLYAQDYENYTYKLSQSTEEIQLWTTTPANKIKPFQNIPSEIQDTIRVYCAKNEFEPFKIIVFPSNNLTVNINLDDFGQGIEAQINQVKHVYLNQATDSLGTTGYYPDPLQVAEFGDDINIYSQVNTAFWITLYVPESAIGGQDYFANLTINTISMPVKLHVFDFAISEEPHVKSQMNFSHQTILSKYSVQGTGDDYWMYVDMIKQFFIDHRLTPKSVLWPGGICGGIEPLIDYDCNGSLTDNYGIWGFDVPSERYLNGNGDLNGQFSELFNNGMGFPSFMFATFTNNDPSVDHRPSPFCGIDKNGTWNNASAQYNEKWFEYIAAINNYIETANLTDKGYYYLANEPQDQDDYDAIAWYSQEIKAVAPDVKLMVSEPPREEIFNNSLYPNAKIDTWLPVMNEYNPTDSWDRETYYDEDTWIYFLHGTALPYFNPITLDHQGVESKFTGWFLWKYRIKGIAYYSLNNWSANPWTDPMNSGQNGNSSMFYPPSETNSNIAYGSNNHRLVPSIRLELLRDGLEDYEYLYELSGGQPQVNTYNPADAQVNRIVKSLMSYTRDPEYMYNLRRLIGLKNGGEITFIPDIEPQPTHWRSEGEPGNYYINFQDPEDLPSTSFTGTVEGVDYKYFQFNDTNYLQVGTNVYREDCGYGWYASNSVNWMTCYDEWFDDHNDLQRSTVYSDYGRKATFEFDLPSGDYYVTISIGKRNVYEHQRIIIEGVTAFDDATTNNQCISTTVLVHVTDNKLSMELGNGEDYTFPNYLMIEAAENQSIEQLKSKNNLLDAAIYPNPFQESFMVELNILEPASVEVTITDLLGKEVYKEMDLVAKRGKNAFEVSPKRELETGIYFYKLKIGNQIVTKKLIRQ